MTDMPPIKSVAPESDTPKSMKAFAARLMQYIEMRNPDLDPRFKGDPAKDVPSIAEEYLEQGKALGVRGDYALFQAILETGSLSFKNGGRQGDVRPEQNNFAGLGATGGGVPGETFKSLAEGVKAHLQHLLLYAGDKIENPIAERTRKVQEWGVLDSWHKRFERPITFADLAEKWAPGSGTYGRMIEAIAERFKDFNKHNRAEADTEPKRHASLTPASSL
ncbi:MAG: glucosaminidase domain-containing protein [Proteobacteria bacterium]|nr:glucosaminidase domain-containing protein [Pseudomonadota bacterium]